MRLSASFVALAASLLVSAAPARNRRADATVLVVKFADVLEQLESAFYAQALQKFQQNDFSVAGFSAPQIAIEQFTNIQKDEATHSQVLQAALKTFGESPITNCQFNFDFALKDVATMAATARVVENVGVAAYLGGATLIPDPVLLDAAGSILTVEARHQTVLNILSGSGTAIPAAFDIPLTPSEILALAAPFFSSPCDLGVPANPTLAITNTGTPAPGTLLTFSSTAINGTVDQTNFHCQMMIGGASQSIALPLSQCVVPDGINGPVAIWVTSDAQPLANNIRDRATTQLIAGPTMAFIDTQPETIGQMVRTGSGIQASVTTQTISPAEASSIIANAAGAAPPAPTDGSSSSSPSSSTPSNSGSASPPGVGGAPAAAPSSSVPGGTTPTTGTPGSALPPGVGGTPGAPVGNAASAPGSTGGAILATGPSADGSLTVLGWKNLPGQ